MADLKPTTNMVSRSTQTDPDAGPTARKSLSFANNPRGTDFLEEPLGYAMLDPYGRRSMAFRRKATGEIVTQTELDEQTGMDKSLLDFYHRQDAFMCFTRFESVRSALLSLVLSYLTMIFLALPWSVYSNFRLSRDEQREERRRETKEVKEK